jgi:hypothetical protein
MEITCSLLTFLAISKIQDWSWIYFDDNDSPPLLQYSQYCLAHAMGPPEVTLKDMILEFLTSIVQLTGTRRGISRTPPWDYVGWPAQPSALWIAVAANLVSTAEFLLKEAHCPQDSDHPEISVAAYYGHLHMVQLLVECGADLNVLGGPYGGPLHAASYTSHHIMVQWLIENGADINMQDMELSYGRHRR